MKSTVTAGRSRAAALRHCWQSAAGKEFDYNPCEVLFLNNSSGHLLY